MPCHNSSFTIRKAIESVIRQTCKDWELIIVNDGSSDNTHEIIEYFAKRDKRIRMINLTEQKGVANARNLGIDSSRYPFIGFLDSDDTLELNFVERMLGIMEEYNCDVVWCQYKILNEEKSIIKSIENQLQKEVRLDNKQILKSFFNYTPGTGAVWNKIYSRNYIEKGNPSRFNPVRRRAEDWEFNLLLFQEAGKFVAIDDCLYNYHQNCELTAMKHFEDSDFPLMFRSIELLKECNDKFGLGYSIEDIIKNNSYPIFEHLFQSTKSTSYSTYRQKIKDKRFKEFFEKIDFSHLPFSYKFPAFFIKYNIPKIAYLVSKAIVYLPVKVK